MNIVRRFKKDILLGLCLFIIPFLLPLFKVSNDLNTLVGATSTVFAIVAGFFIADAMSNYLRLQTLIAEENAALISLAEDSKKIDKINYVGLHRAIDRYLIAQLDLETLNHISMTEKEVDAIRDGIDDLKVDPGEETFLDHILSMQEKIFACRQEISLAAKKNLTTWHWIILVTLGSLVAVTVLGLRDGALSMNLISGLIIVGTQSVLILLREMDSNHLLELKLAYGNPREVFHAISQPPYYPYGSPTQNHIPDEDGKYRLGKLKKEEGKEYDLINI